MQAPVDVIENFCDVFHDVLVLASVRNAFYICNYCTVEHKMSKPRADEKVTDWLITSYNLLVQKEEYKNSCQHYSSSENDAEPFVHVEMLLEQRDHCVAFEVCLFHN